MEEINERILKLTGTANLPRDLQIGHDYTIALQVNVNASETRNNEDGTCDVIFKCRPTGEIIITKDYGEKMVLKSRNSVSKRIRNSLFYKWTELGLEGDFQEWYESIGSKIIANLDKIIEL